jgi:hypothetical protein
MQSGSHIKEFHCRLINGRLAVQWEGMIAHIEGAKTHLAPMQHSSGTSLRLNWYVFFQMINHVHASVQADGWPFLTFVYPQ